ncbi:hypothetical protein CDR68_19120 [Salmonella enterica]|nr:hypothetical protein [Salmonella enterica]
MRISSSSSVKCVITSFDLQRREWCVKKSLFQDKMRLIPPYGTSEDGSGLDDWITRPDKALMPSSGKMNSVVPAS